MFNITSLFAELRKNMEPLAAFNKDNTVKALGPGAKLVALVREGYSLQDLPEAPPEVPPRRHAFADVRSAAAFLLHHGFNPATTEILATDDEILIANAQQHHRDELSVEMRLDPIWKLWVGALGRAYDMQTLRELLSGRRRDFVDAAVAAQVLAGLQELSIISIDTATMQMDDRGTLRFSGSNNKKDIDGKVPNGFRVKCPLYLGGPEYEIEVEIGMSLPKGGGLPTFTLRAPERERLEVDAFEAELKTFAELLNEGRDEDAVPFLVSRGQLSFSG